MGIIISFISLAISVFYLIGLIKLLSKAGASTVQIVIAILFQPYLWYLLGIISNKKGVAIALIIVSIIGALLGFLMINDTVHDITTYNVAYTDIDETNLSENAYQNLIEAREEAFMDDMIKSIMSVYLFLIPLNLVILILESIINWGIGRNFNKNVGFCIGLILLPRIFIPILGFEESSTSNFGY